jgi:hypothetical protein
MALNAGATPDRRKQQAAAGDADEEKEVWYRNTDAQGSPYFFCRAKGLSQWTEPTGENVVVREYKRKAPVVASASGSPSTSGTVSDSDPGSPASRNASPYDSPRQSALGTTRASVNGGGDDDDDDISDASALSDVWCVGAASACWH